MQIPIKRAIERVPGGMMVVPLAIGAIIATLLPGHAEVLRLLHRRPLLRRAADPGGVLRLHGRQHRLQGHALHPEEGRHAASA